MANVKYFSLYNNLNDWPGNLFENRGDSTLTTKTATNLTITHGATHPFSGFKIVFTGSGMVYNGNDVVDGVIISVTVKNAANQNVLQISNLSSALIASDIASLLPLIMGFTNPGNPNLNTETKAAWSQLLTGNDVITGTANDDRSLVGVDGGNDTYNMGAGNDYINAGIGNDTYNGGDGWDTLSFRETVYNEGITATRGINVNMTTGVVLDAWGGTDTINSIESILGSRFRDIIVGNADGNDISGGRGSDTIDGGGGNDWIIYGDDVWQGGSRGINANLATGFVIDGFGTRDTVSNVERVAGTRFNDIFVGDGGKNYFAGGEERDSYDGGGNVNDSGEGDFIIFDWHFSDAIQTGVNVNLALATGQIVNDGFGNVESCVNIEGAIGTDQNDILRGNTGKNLFAGHDGQDTMSGGANTDEFIWWDIDHFDDGDVITDFNATLDKLSFEQDNFFNMNSIIIENDMTANTTNGTFLFNTVTKVLYWDENGSNAGGQFAIVTLNNVAGLTATNFELY